VVGDVFDGDPNAGDAQYQLARRFFKRHPRLFKTDARGRLTWIIPQPEAFTELNLRQQYAQRKTSVRDGDAPTDIQTGDKTGKLYAKGKVNQFLEGHLTVQSDAVRGSLLKQLVTDIETTAERWAMFERVRGEGDDYMCQPHRTRHNDAGRARDIRDGFNDALDAASDGHNDGVMLTLTTDPKQHDGLHDALDSLSKNKGRLMQWLSTDYQLGHRPTNLTALQFMRSGIPHLHLVLFGIDWAISQRQLSAKWDDYGQGEIVDIRAVTSRGDGGEWLLHDDESGKKSLRQYLGRHIRELQSIANSDPYELRDHVESGDVTPWRQVLYWATERRYFTCSPSLRETDGDGGDGLPTVKQWEFIGTAVYSDIPAHIKQEATFNVDPPP
jgi:hypothetical protein